MYFGYIAATILVILLTLFPAKLYCINKKECRYYTNVYKKYTILKIAVVFFALIHFYYVGFRISGILLLLSIITMMVIGEIGRWYNNKFIYYHKISAFIVLAFFLFHILSPRWF